jgi:hypothetical protein
MSLGVMKAAERNRNSVFSRIKGRRQGRGDLAKYSEISIPRYLGDVKFPVLASGIPIGFTTVVAGSAVTRIRCVFESDRMMGKSCFRKGLHAVLSVGRRTAN